MPLTQEEQTNQWIMELTGNDPKVVNEHKDACLFLLYDDGVARRKDVKAILGDRYNPIAFENAMEEISEGI